MVRHDLTITEQYYHKIMYQSKTSSLPLQIIIRFSPVYFRNESLSEAHALNEYDSCMILSPL